MNVEDFLAHVKAREAGKRMVHMAHTGVFPKAEDRERFLSEPWFVVVPTEAEWEAKAIAMHAAQVPIFLEAKPEPTGIRRNVIARGD